jgi:uncharacterized protein YdhG (YjbR/CyaY superfamily)
MARTNYLSVTEYIAAQPPKTRVALKQVRTLIRKVLPNADEVISYQIAAYKIDGVPVVFFAGWKEHFSIYPASTALVAACQKELSRFEVSKGTIRFPLSEPVPERLITRIAKFREKEARVIAELRAQKKRARAAAKRGK